MFSGCNAGAAKCLGCEVHEPLIELINGSGNISLPKMRFIRIDSFIHFQAIHMEGATAMHLSEKNVKPADRPDFVDLHGLAAMQT